MNRTVVLICGPRKRTYPVPDGVELKDSYTLDGERWVVVAVLTSEDAALRALVQMSPNPLTESVK